MDIIIYYYSIECYSILWNTIIPNYSDRERIMYMSGKSPKFPVVLQEVTNIQVGYLETLYLLPIFKLLPVCCS